MPPPPPQEPSREQASLEPEEPIGFEMPPPPPQGPSREYPSPEPEEPIVRGDPPLEQPIREEPPRVPTPGPLGRQPSPPPQRQAVIIQSRSSAYSDITDDDEGIESEPEVRHPLSNTWVWNPQLREQGAPRRPIQCQRAPLPDIEAPPALPYVAPEQERRNVQRGAAMGNPADIAIFNTMMIRIMNETIMPQVWTLLQPRNIGLKTLGDRIMASLAQQDGWIQEMAHITTETAQQANATANNAYHTHEASKALAPRIQHIEDTLQTLPGLINETRKEVQDIKGRTDALNEMIQALDERISRIEGEPRKGAGSQRTASPNFRPERESTHPPDDREIPKGVKAKKPDPFKGKRGQEAESFLMRMDMYFNDYLRAFDTPRNIRTTLSNMAEGEASKWVKPLLAKELREEDHPALHTWVEFKKYFLVAFGDPIKKERAIREMGKLTQTGSAQHYASQF